MRKRVSDTAEFGDLTRGPRIVGKTARKEMEKILKEIQNGKFAKEFLDDYKKGKKNFEKLRHADDRHQIEQVGSKLRGMMKWL
jgi:ketol-acid reductoisomerase